MTGNRLGTEKPPLDHSHALDRADRQYRSPAVLMIRCLSRHHTKKQTDSSAKLCRSFCMAMQWHAPDLSTHRVCPRPSYQIRRASCQDALIIASCEVVRADDAVWPMLSGPFEVWTTGEGVIEGSGSSSKQPPFWTKHHQLTLQHSNATSAGWRFVPLASSLIAIFASLTPRRIPSQSTSPSRHCGSAFRASE